MPTPRNVMPNQSSLDLFIEASLSTVHLKKWITFLQQPIFHQFICIVFMKTYEVLSQSIYMFRRKVCGLSFVFHTASALLYP
jgi:hypothetical protein